MQMPRYPAKNTDWRLSHASLCGDFRRYFLKLCFTLSRLPRPTEKRIQKSHDVQLNPEVGSCYRRGFCWYRKSFICHFEIGSRSSHHHEWNKLTQTANTRHGAEYTSTAVDDALDRKTDGSTPCRNSIHVSWSRNGTSTPGTLSRVWWQLENNS